MIEFGNKDFKSAITNLFSVLKDLKKSMNLIRREVKDKF